MPRTWTSLGASREYRRRWKLPPTHGWKHTARVLADKRLLDSVPSGAYFSFAHSFARACRGGRKRTVSEHGANSSRGLKRKMSGRCSFREKSGRRRAGAAPEVFSPPMRPRMKLAPAQTHHPCSYGRRARRERRAFGGLARRGRPDGACGALRRGGADEWGAGHRSQARFKIGPTFPETIAAWGTVAIPLTAGGGIRSLRRSARLSERAPTKLQ